MLFRSEKLASEIGINNSDHIIVYDSLGIFSAPRVWWMFNYFGHKKISILDGGLVKWKNENKKMIFMAYLFTSLFLKCVRYNRRFALNVDGGFSIISLLCINRNSLDRSDFLFASWVL